MMPAMRACARGLKEDKRTDPEVRGLQELPMPHSLFCHAPWVFHRDRGR